MSLCLYRALSSIFSRASAARNLVKKLGGEIVECAFIVDLSDLHGREKLEKMGEKAKEFSKPEAGKIIAEYIISNPTMKVEIGGHTDNKGTNKYNHNRQQLAYSKP